MNVPDRAMAIAKELSVNDTGETGTHQDGILVPKKPWILSFFPRLDGTQKNPRHHLIFIDDDGRRWEFAFIYYNNRAFGGTRNEYRLTRTTPYIRGAGLRRGDQLILRRDESGTRLVTFKRAQPLQWTTRGALKLSGEWREIKF